MLLSSRSPQRRRRDVFLSVSVRKNLIVVFVLALFLSYALQPNQSQAQLPASPRPRVAASAEAEYLWYEAENMRGFATKPTGEPIQNPSYLNLPRSKAPGWGINGPGVSAEWSQGGESEWNSAAASADETAGKIYQDVEIPRAGNYKLWVRYADRANKSEPYFVRITQGEREVFRHEFGAKDVVDSYDEVSVYWGCAFTWDGAGAQLEKGPARISIEREKPAAPRRHVRCVLLTKHLAYVPEGRRKPDFAAARYLREWSNGRAQLSSLLRPQSAADAAIPPAWRRPPVAGRDS